MYCKDIRNAVVWPDDQRAVSYTHLDVYKRQNPDCKVWVGVGAGAMIGSNTALLAKYGGAGKIPEDCGVITTDAVSYTHLYRPVLFFADL